MGAGRDKRKKAKEKKDGPLPGKGHDKTEKKTEKNEMKKERRAEKELQKDEDNIDALLAKFAIEDKAKKAVEIENDCPPPSARVNASFTAVVAPKVNDIIVYGGEYCELDSGRVHVYGDLFRFNTDKKKWSKAVLHKNSLYVFGGEFTSPNQAKFHHYKDLWRLDLATYEWDQLAIKGGPSARSGHRMVVHKNRILLFGGFYDTGREVKYYNDLWEFDIGELKWRALGKAGQQQPTPRSGGALALHGDLLYCYGGYSKCPDDEDEDIEHGKVMDDMWALDLKTHTWDKVKKAGMAPGPRASFSLVAHKARAFLFGGVSDNEAKGGEDLSSEFHNDLYTFNMDNRRWYAAELRPPKGSKAQQQEQQQHQEQEQQQQEQQQQQQGSSSAVDPAMQELVAKGQDKDSALYKAAVRIQSRFRGYVVRKAYKVYKLGGVLSEILYSPAAFGLDMSVKNMPKPRSRISAQVCVLGNTLYLMGGIVEVGEKEITLDDMWSLDLAKLDGWQVLRENTIGEEMFVEDKAKESSDDWETDDDE